MVRNNAFIIKAIMDCYIVRFNQTALIVPNWLSETPKLPPPTTPKTPSWWALSLAHNWGVPFPYRLRKLTVFGKPPEESSAQSTGSAGKAIPSELRCCQDKCPANQGSPWFAFIALRNHAWDSLRKISTETNFEKNLYGPPLLDCT